ncbi:MAG: uncharacterized protein V7637_5495 [Mycobacteriales bacterium]|jgi:uncharacterized membrane protein YfcA
MQAVALLGAGVLAGLVSTVISLASIVSYPALLAVGLPPLAANVTNTVALVGVGLGAAGGSRPELAGQGRLVARLGVLTVLGGATGAALLLLLPARSFEYAAPWLIGGACLVLLRPRRPGTLPVGQTDGPRHPAAGRIALLAASAYIGYFGAAGGILMLATLTTLVDQPLARTNAIKNMVSGLANAVAAVGFALFGPVRWAAAAPLAAGFVVGGWIGPALVRRLPAGPLRLLVAGCGLLVAVKLGLDTYG